MKNGHKPLTNWTEVQELIDREERRQRLAVLRQVRRDRLDMILYPVKHRYLRAFLIFGGTCAAVLGLLYLALTAIAKQVGLQ